MMIVVGGKDIVIITLFKLGGVDWAEGMWGNGNPWNALSILMFIVWLLAHWDYV